MFLFLLLNFVISWFNAWGCGKTWAGTKARGGVPHLMNWMSAIMSASGFTWCYTLILGMVGAVVPLKELEDGTKVPYVTDAMLTAIGDLGYLIVIGPILGSGLAITVQSWRHFARRRSLGTGVVTGWNTYAQISNTINAFEHVPAVWDNLGTFFRSDSKDNKGVGIIIVTLLVAVALLGGVLTTYGIIRMTMHSQRQREILEVMTRQQHES